MTTLHPGSWDQYAAVAERRISELTAENERLRAALAKAAQTFIDLAPCDGTRDATAYFQAAVDTGAINQQSESNE